MHIQLYTGNVQILFHCSRPTGTICILPPVPQISQIYQTNILQIIISAERIN